VTLREWFHDLSSFLAVILVILAMGAWALAA
jgi:hypothetical protein